MIEQRQYWIISPKVDDEELNVENWKKEILSRHAAFICWSPDNFNNGGMGPRFCGNPKSKSKVQIGDVILIARSHNLQPDLVGFGIVKGKCQRARFPWSEQDVYFRDLEHFTLCEGIKGINFIKNLRYPGALHQLDQQGKGADICQWMEQKLKVEAETGIGKNKSVSARSHFSGFQETELQLSSSFGYKVKVKAKIKTARQTEKRLLSDYRHWLEKQGRHLRSWKFNLLQCDAWEQERANLVEAKGSTSREDIRMAVGQLFDYAFQVKEIFKQPNKAILLQKYPDNDRTNWLEPLGIKIIWRKGRSFMDNANGQFI